MDARGSVSSQFWIQLLLFVLAMSSERAAAARTTTTDQPAKAGSDHAGLAVPAGTILPVRLNRGFSSKTARAGQAISGRVMQDVPLPGGAKIPAGAKVVGAIVSVSSVRSGKQSDGIISFHFNEVRHNRQTAKITASLRAIGSLLEVAEAQLPETPAGFGTPYNWVTTRLIGGDVKYGVGGPVTDSGSATVGEGTREGVLVHVRAQSTGGCPGESEGSDRLQALWLFSAGACGVYGMPRLRIVQAGRTVPVGETTLSYQDGEVNLRAGSGLLLRVE